MLSLREVQRRVHDCLLDEADTAAWPLVVDAGLAPGHRLDIYRNTIAGTLGRALRLTYPAVQRLVGTDFFEGAAAIFARDHLPQCADLDAYGGDFANFLERFEPAASVVYLPDVARLEWAVNRALHACDAEPAISRVKSKYPVDAIWRSILEQDADGLKSIDLAEGPVLLRIERRGDRAVVSRLKDTEEQR